MSRLQEFRFRWMDAWWMIDCGCDCELRISANGEAIIDGLVNLEPCVINLAGIEDAFISDLEATGVCEWDKKLYEPYEAYLDGYMWTLEITYDSRRICARGENGYPASFPRFLNILHEKYNLPKSKIEAGLERADFIEDTKITEIDEFYSTLGYMTAAAKR